ncbi:hypothetical protein NDU88_001170, partial [Pleurodeles waltl]
IFSRAGRGRNRFAGRSYLNQGSRGYHNPSYQEYRPQFYPRISEVSAPEASGTQALLLNQ